MRDDGLRWLSHDLPPRAFDADAWRKTLVTRGWWITPRDDDPSQPAAWMRELHAALAHLEEMEDALARARSTHAGGTREPGRAELAALALLGLAVLVALGVAIHLNAFAWIRMLAGGSVTVPAVVMLARRRQRVARRVTRVALHTAATRDVERLVRQLTATRWRLHTELGQVGYRPLGDVQPGLDDDAPAPVAKPSSLLSSPHDPGLDGVEALPAPWDDAS